ncbi:chloride channel protein [Tychonema sp. LEGE 07199]|uniref:chloride channel protein n=2 Tax=Microcoleaceae TaxID=1892252 RepID=UPI00187E1641|nr:MULTISPECIES: chloride channel protein [unclassified Tychonema]MBE9119691.1 chloride channel protein [Tychonema sp. LEGE 07199]MBE9130754.1 chloride channel protein [Tychonema sp. LEGE 07196]
MPYITIPKQFREPSRIVKSQLFLKPRRLAIFEACLIGLVAGIAGVLLKSGVGWLGSWRVASSTLIPVWILLPSVGLAGGFLTGLLVERLAPETAGSGIPHVKAALGGVNLALDLRVAVAKLLTTILAVGSGLSLGRQGPTVQIGASLAGWIGHLMPTSPDYRRQLIACGAAAGLAAGFNAPIAGVLFVVEELLQDVSGLTLGTAIIASFIGAVVSQLLGGDSLNLNLREYPISFQVSEIPFFILLGVLAGIFGALFSKGIIASLNFNKRTLKLSLPVRIALAGIICGSVIAFLPETFRNNTGLREFLLTGEANAITSLTALIAHFCLTIISAASGAPGGLFSPSLVMGSALGQLVGILQENSLGVGLPTTYALAGMGAFFCAVSRAPITAVVIVFEITADFKLVLPLMICSVVAYLVAEKVDSGSLYSHLLEFNGIQLTQAKAATNTLSDLHANDVMQRRVETLSSLLTLDEVMQAFSRSHHRGFPVVDGGKLVGIVSQTDLANTSNRNFSGNSLLKEFMTAQPITVKASDTLSEVLHRLNYYHLSRLPVVEGRHLVGIITRSDIIRVESDRLSGETTQGPHPEPSYVVYQTKAPQVGNGRLLVPLSNPQTAPALLRLAAAIARDRNYELECLQIIIVPRNSSPSESAVRTTKSRRLLQQAERIIRNWNLPVHTQIRVAHDVPNAILETIKERHIDLILMGWQGELSTKERIFGDVVDTVIRQAGCEVVLVKWSKQLLIKSHKNVFSTSSDGREYASKEWQLNAAKVDEAENSTLAASSSSATPETELLSPNSDIPVPELGLHTLMSLRRWLVPIRGGYKQAAALRLLPALVAASSVPEIKLCQIHQPSVAEPSRDELKQAAEFVQRRVRCSVVATAVCATSVSDALIDQAQNDQCDAIVLGASREGLLKQVIHGNIPEAVARGCDCTVILVRSAS